MGLSPVYGTSTSSTKDKRIQLEPEWRNKQQGMRYRMLGATGMMVSAIGIGGGKVPVNNYEYILEAIDRGVNYIDTAHGYGSGNNELMVGKLLNEVGRDKMFVATKLSGWKWKIDEYCMEIFNKLTSSDQAHLRKKSEDLIEKLGVSQPGYYYSLFNRHDKEIPSGYLTYVIRQEFAHLEKWKSAFKSEMHKSINESLSRMQTDYVDILHAPLPQKCYAWVLNNPNIAGCVSAMSNKDILEENLAVLDKDYEINPI